MYFNFMSNEYKKIVLLEEGGWDFASSDKNKQID